MISEQNYKAWEGEAPAEPMTCRMRLSRSFALPNTARFSSFDWRLAIPDRQVESTNEKTAKHAKSFEATCLSALFASLAVQ